MSMEFDDVIRRRRMVRAFTTEPLAEGATDRILAAANRAPSAGFSQGYAFLVLETPEQLTPFWALMDEADDALDPDDPFSPANIDPAVLDQYARLRRAPLVIVPLSCKQAYLDRYARPDKGWTDGSEVHWPVPYWDVDTGFTALLMLLSAVDQGLGALLFGFGTGGGEIDGLRRLYGVPDEYVPIGAVAIGHRDPDFDQRGSAKTITRRSIADVAHRGRW